MYRHEGSLCETGNSSNGVKSPSNNDPAMPTFIRRTSLRDMHDPGDVDDLIEEEEDAIEVKHSNSNLRFHAKGIPIPLSPSNDHGPIVGKLPSLWSFIFKLRTLGFCVRISCYDQYTISSNESLFSDAFGMIDLTCHMIGCVINFIGCLIFQKLTTKCKQI